MNRFRLVLVLRSVLILLSYYICHTEWATDTFVTNYLPLMLFPVLYCGARLWYRQAIVSPQDMDFVTGLDVIEADR